MEQDRERLRVAVHVERDAGAGIAGREPGADDAAGGGGDVVGCLVAAEGPLAENVESVVGCRGRVFGAVGDVGLGPERVLVVGGAVEGEDGLGRVDVLGGRGPGECHSQVAACRPADGDDLGAVGADVGPLEVEVG